MISIINIAHAQSASQVLSKSPSIRGLLDSIALNIITPILGLMFLLSFVTFVYGIFKMIASQEDSEARENGKQSIFWSAAGMFIMVSAYGIIRLIVSTLAPVGVTDPFQ